MLLVALAAVPSIATSQSNHNGSRHLLGGCSIVKPLDTSGGSGMEALVRGHQYTLTSPSGCMSSAAHCSAESLDPQCGSGFSASSCEEQTCNADSVHVRYNSRTYALATDSSSSACGGRTFGSPYDCVDYAGGAYSLAGKTLSFMVDLSSAGCGCNAAVYLVAMPKNLDATTCRDHCACPQRARHTEQATSCDPASALMCSDRGRRLRLPHGSDCDANAVCGARCVEIDLMEANSVAFVSTVHVADDPNGEAFGIAHYVTPVEKRLKASLDCPYGPRSICAIDTTKPFTASFAFASSGFEYRVALEQEGRMASKP